MKPYVYTEKDWPTFAKGQSLEWVLTNGLGSYGGRSLIDSQSRTHHGYLIASLHSPTLRHLILSHVTEQLGNISLETAQYFHKTSTCKEGQKHLKEVTYREGQKHLKEVSYDGASITFTYEHRNFSLIKEIALQRRENTCAIYYRIENKTARPLNFSMTPYFNFREHSENSVPGDFHFSEKEIPGSYLLTPDSHPEYAICFSYSNGILKHRQPSFEAPYQLQIEVELETEGLDYHYAPVLLTTQIEPEETQELSITCSLLRQEDIKYHMPILDTSAKIIIADTRAYYKKLVEKSGAGDELSRRLVVAGDHFICHRASTGKKTVLAGLPWFTDWGRDTMIAFTGLTLCSNRMKEAEEILITFAQYVRNGIVPNMFPDNNTPPLYNTVDASLWYFYAVERYLTYMKKAGEEKEALAFIRENLYPALKEIQTAYEKGTDFNIGMDMDGLIFAGSDLDQITWMDVRVGAFVPTPRHGKPVEINALWYNALKVMEQLSEAYHEDSTHYRELSELTKKSFRDRFWNTEKNCLYDVVDEHVLGKDVIMDNDMVRPNQIYAVSLPYTMLDEDSALRVVEKVHEELFVGCGIRSLSPYDKEYHGIYCGALSKRDAAYHQGTAWGFLLGGFISAYCKVHHHDEESRAQAMMMLEHSIYHLSHSGCIGSISEIFDGDAPHKPRGCYAQAWSVGELLRCYLEDILGTFLLS